MSDQVELHGQGELVPSKGWPSGALGSVHTLSARLRFPPSSWGKGGGGGSGGRVVVQVFCYFSLGRACKELHQLHFTVDDL